MASKKRKKSNTERINYEKRRAERKIEAKREARKKALIGLVIFAAVVGVFIGIIFGAIAIADAIKDARRPESDDYSEYYVTGAGKDYTAGHDVVYADIKVKGYGTITVLLDKTAAPKTVENFVNLAKEGFYDGLTFHRIMENFMIQGGDPDANGTGGKYDENGKKQTIVGEFSANGVTTNGFSHKRGVISMARGSGYDTASSQFFICNADASASLDGKYAAFGYVIDGLIIVDKITEDYIKYADTENSNTIAKRRNQPVIESITIRDSL